MLFNYFIVAAVFAIALSFVAIIHFFWLRGGEVNESQTSLRSGHIYGER